MSRNLFWAVMCAVSLIAATPQDSRAASAYEIDVGVDETLERFYYSIRGARELAHKAVGILVFPSVVKAGFGFGGEYGEGALRIRGRTVDYYNTLSASVGFQLGVQERSVIIMFMTPDALDQFRRTAGWKVGADASVAIITVGIGGSIDTNKITSPVVGFILDPKGRRSAASAASVLHRPKSAWALAPRRYCPATPLAARRSKFSAAFFSSFSADSPAFFTHSPNSLTSSL
jgi:lipid-binding SYLF domain-containing protein